MSARVEILERLIGQAATFGAFYLTASEVADAIEFLEAHPKAAVVRDGRLTVLAAVPLHLLPEWSTQ